MFSHLFHTLPDPPALGMTRLQGLHREAARPFDDLSSLPMAVQWEVFAV